MKELILRRVSADVLNYEYLPEDRQKIIYDIIYKDISNFRNIQKESIEEKKFIKSKNVVSLLGERGTGKTSMLNTILDILKNENKFLNYKRKENDIVFPIIDPDVFNSEDDVMGWIINLFQAEVENTELENGNFCSGDMKKKSLIKIYQKLQDTYIRSTKFYKEIIAKNSSGSFELNENIRETSLANIYLEKVFKDFLNEFTKQKLVKTDLENGLIFLSFDDLDLNQEYGPTVLKSISQYLDHPSIVVFVLGEEETFEESIILSQKDKYNYSIQKLEITLANKNKDFNESSYEYDDENDYGRDYQGNKYRIKDKDNNLFNNIISRSKSFMLKSLPKIFRHKIEPLTPLEVLNFLPYGNKDKYDSIYELIIELKETHPLKKIFNLFFINSSLKKNKKIKKGSLIPYSEIINHDNMRDLINFYYCVIDLVHESKDIFATLLELLNILGIDINDGEYNFNIDVNIREIFIDYDPEIEFIPLIYDDEINRDPQINISNIDLYNSHNNFLSLFLYDFSHEYLNKESGSMEEIPLAEKQVINKKGVEIYNYSFETFRDMFSFYQNLDIPEKTNFFEYLRELKKNILKEFRDLKVEIVKTDDIKIDEFIYNDKKIDLMDFAISEKTLYIAFVEYMKYISSLLEINDIHSIFRSDTIDSPQNIPKIINKLKFFSIFKDIYEEYCNDENLLYLILVYISMKKELKYLVKLKPHPDYKSIGNKYINVFLEYVTQFKGKNFIENEFSESFERESVRAIKSYDYALAKILYEYHNKKGM